jgi:STE24 endopeptidase
MMQDPEQLKLDPNRQERAHEYARIRRRLMLLNLLFGSGYLLLWLLLDWAPQVRSALTETTAGGLLPFRSHWIIQLLLFTAAIGVPWSLVDLPLSYYSGYILPHRFELSNQTIRGWISDQLKGALLSAIIGAPLLIGVFALLRCAPQTWWVWGAAGYASFSILLTALAPILFMPIFYRFKPLGDDYAELEEKLLHLSKKAGTHVRGVFTFDMSRRTPAANAALTGLGRSRRIILGDTLLENFSEDEIETVLAHELAHHVHRDIPLGIAIQVPLTFLFFYLIHLMLRWAVGELGLNGIADPASLPFLGLVFSGLGLITMPLFNAWSRWREHMADTYALEMTKKPKAFASAMTRLANQNLVEADPEAWIVFLLYSHPPLRKRIDHAQAWASTASR